MNANTKLWLSRHHPAHYEEEGEMRERCPTCQEPSPCRVREVFLRFDLLVKTYGETLAPKWYGR